MKVDIIMPKMGESISEGTIIKWYKKVGDKVEKDEIIFEIATDKVDTEIPSPESGVLTDIKVFENETVEVGTVVAVIGTNGDAEIKEEKKEPSTVEIGGDIIDIPMPKMGESVMEGTIIKWYKKVGDSVDLDETIFEIATDKVDTEVPSPAKGILKEILVGENETVEVGTVVAKLETTTGIKKQNKEEKPVEQVNVQENVQQNVKTEPKEKIKSNKFFSPLVLNIARKENISVQELENIKGTGINGRVTKKDVLNYLKSGRKTVAKSAPIEPAGKPAEVTQPTQVPFDGGTEIIPMDNIRKRIMQHMVNSRDTSVHVTGVLEVDMSKIYNFLKKNKERILREEGIKLTYMPFISYAVIKALKEFPLMNASIEDNNIIMKKFINLGIAVAVEPNGLIVPNIKNADEKNIRGLAKAINDLGNRARTKNLLPDDIVNGTFTITNYGVFGSLFGTPIINQPEVGILGAGAVVKKPVVVEVDGNDVIAIKPMMYLSISHDHRLVDGMLGGRFLKSVKDTLENFDESLL